MPVSYTFHPPLSLVPLSAPSAIITHASSNLLIEEFTTPMLSANQNADLFLAVHKSTQTGKTCDVMHPHEKLTISDRLDLPEAERERGTGRGS